MQRYYRPIQTHTHVHAQLLFKQSEYFLRRGKPFVSWSRCKTQIA